MSTTLLPTKWYMPPALPHLVLRPRLSQMLDQAQHGRLTLVSAPAGFGKTTLVSQWLHQRHQPAAWLSLDGSDDQFARFFTYLIAALQSVVPGLAQELRQHLASAQPPAAEATIQALLTELGQQPQPLILVLDDYHTIHSQAIHQALAYCLDYLPPHLHLIITSRQDPPLPLPRWRVRGQLAEVRADDLRFNAAESAAFLRQTMALALDDPAVQELNSRTEGWVAGLKLAALSLRGAGDVQALISTFTGRDRLVADYLLAEVMERQSPQLQRFLRTTAILERFNAPLCDHLLEHSGSQDILDQLEQNNLFIIPLDNQRYWYRYHHLFAQMLRQRLQRHSSASDIAGLHQRAARWFEQHGLRQEAVSHALLAGRADYAAQLISAIPFRSIWEQDGAGLIKQWAGALDDAHLRAVPQVAILAAAAHMITGEVQPVLHYLSLAADQAQVRGEFHLLRAIICRSQGDLPLALKLARQALDELSPDQQTLRISAQLQVAVNHMELGHLSQAEQAAAVPLDDAIADLNTRLQVVRIAAALAFSRADFSRAATLLRDAASAAESSPGPPPLLVGLIYSYLGRVHYEWNELADAADYYQRAMALGSRSAITDILFDAHVGQAELACLRGDQAAVLQAMETILSLANASQLPDVIAISQAILARFQLRLGSLETALRWANSAGLTLDDRPDFRSQPIARLFAAVRLAEYRQLETGQLVPRLVAFLDHLIALSRQGGYTFDLVENLILRSQALAFAGDTQAAVKDLEAALVLAQPGSLIRTFVDAGPDLLGLLALVGGRLQPYARRISRAYAAASATPPATAAPAATAAAPLLEPLTQREHQVLEAIAAGLSNRQIEEALVISKNTVRSHIKHLYSKLEVSSRTQAVEKARRLGLL